MEQLRIILEIVGLASEVLLLGVVSMRSAARNVPTFQLYLYWTVLTDLVGAVCYYRGWSGYLTFYNLQATVEEFLLIAILFDLARFALRSLPTALARGILGFFGILTACTGALVWRASDSWTLLSHYSGWHLLLRLQLTSSLVRVLLLLLIGGLIEFLSRHYIALAWGERELHIATGMGIYALASLAESLAATYQRLLTVSTYPLIGAAVTLSYELCILYWIVSFLRLDRGAAKQAPETVETQPGPGPSTLWQKGIGGVLENPIVGEIARPGRA